MPTLIHEITKQVRATDVHFTGNILDVSLSDGREISILIEPVEWLQWLVNATPEQRVRWSLEPGGFAIYREELPACACRTQTGMMGSKSVICSKCSR